MSWLLWVACFSVGGACAAIIGSRFFKASGRPRRRPAMARLA